MNRKKLLLAISLGLSVALSSLFGVPSITLEPVISQVVEAIASVIPGDA